MSRYTLKYSAPAMKQPSLSTCMREDRLPFRLPRLSRHTPAAMITAPAVAVSQDRADLLRCMEIASLSAPGQGMRPAHDASAGPGAARKPTITIPWFAGVVKGRAAGSRKYFARGIATAGPKG